MHLHSHSTRDLSLATAVRQGDSVGKWVIMVVGSYCWVVGSHDWWFIYITCLMMDLYWGTLLNFFQIPESSHKRPHPFWGRGHCLLTLGQCKGERPFCPLLQGILQCWKSCGLVWQRKRVHCMLTTLLFLATQASCLNDGVFIILR